MKFDHSRGVLARALAVATNLRADPAVLVVVAVATAFVSAKAARLGACLRHRADERRVRASPTRRDRPHCRTNVGAIEIQPNALAELDDGTFSQTCVGAGSANLGAIETEFDAVHERAVNTAADLRMSGNDGFDMHGLLRSTAPGPARGRSPRDSGHDLDACRGFPLRFVEAMSCNCCSVMDSTMDFDAAWNSLFFFSPRLAASAAPAAFCWAFDLAGTILDRRERTNNTVTRFSSLLSRHATKCSSD